MAAYPSIGMRTVVSPVASIIIDTAVSGAVRGIDLSAEDVFEIEVIHPFISAADRNTIISFYNTNKALIVALDAADGNTYDVMFKARPTVEVINATWFTVTANMVGNIQ